MGGRPARARSAAIRVRNSRKWIALTGVVPGTRRSPNVVAASTVTVTRNRCVATELSAPVAVTVMVATPAAAGVTVTCAPDTLTVATPGAEDAAR